MASPRAAARAFKKFSPQQVQRVLNVKEALSPKTPIRNSLTVDSILERQRVSPVFNVDTPHKRKILNEGFLDNCRKVLGNGAFGTVYKASYKGEPVAAKVIKYNSKEESSIKVEKQTAFLNHLNIVKVFKVDEGPVLTLITMELCGKSLQTIIEEKEVSKKERIQFWKSIAKALRYCHRMGIVHADVKPKNVLLGMDNQPKLGDFGSSVLMNKPYKASNFHGTPGYAAPEVVSGNKPTPLSDIYSLGITAWQMLSRKPPFAGLHLHTILYLTGKGITPTECNSDDGFEGQYKDLYEKSWSKSSKDRPSLVTIIKSLNTLEVEIS